METIKEHRFLLVLRGQNTELSPEIHDTDPQETGREPLLPGSYAEPARRKTALLIREFIKQASSRLSARQPANFVLLRGFASLPDWPRFEERFGLTGCSAAAYPMYRGLSQLLGMTVLPCEEALASKLSAIRHHWKDFNFFFLHVKGADSAGEDGDFERKVKVIEDVDRAIPALLKLGPEVLLVTGDHSTPAVLKSHSWHPVPVLLWSRCCRSDPVNKFGERACLSGALGPRLPATELMPLALANAARLKKFGA